MSARTEKPASKPTRGADVTALREHRSNRVRVGAEQVLPSMGERIGHGTDVSGTSGDATAHTAASVWSSS